MRVSSQGWRKYNGDDDERQKRAVEDYKEER
jgi:hypothetical protein